MPGTDSAASILDFTGGLISAGVKTYGDWQMTDWANRESERRWKMQNEYNTPYMQMERLKAAGLNPKLVYGHGAVTQAGEMPSVQRSEVTAPAGEIGKFTEIRNMNAQLDNLRAQNDLTKMETILKAANAVNVDLANRDAARELGIKLDMDKKYPAFPQQKGDVPGMPSLLKVGAGLSDYYGNAYHTGAGVLESAAASIKLAAKKSAMMLEGMYGGKYDKH